MAKKEPYLNRPSFVPEVSYDITKSPMQNIINLLDKTKKAYSAVYNEDKNNNFKIVESEKQDVAESGDEYGIYKHSTVYETNVESPFNSPDESNIRIRVTIDGERREIKLDAFDSYPGEAYVDADEPYNTIAPFTTSDPEKFGKEPYPAITGKHVVAYKRLGVYELPFLKGFLGMDKIPPKGMNIDQYGFPPKVFSSDLPQGEKIVPYNTDTLELLDNFLRGDSGFDLSAIQYARGIGGRVATGSNEVVLVKQLYDEFINHCAKSNVTQEMLNKDNAISFCGKLNITMVAEDYANRKLYVAYGDLVNPSGVFHSDGYRVYPYGDEDVGLITDGYSEYKYFRVSDLESIGAFPFGRAKVYLPWVETFPEAWKDWDWSMVDTLDVGTKITSIPAGAFKYFTGTLVVRPTLLSISAEAGIEEGSSDTPSFSVACSPLPGEKERVTDLLSKEPSLAHINVHSAGEGVFSFVVVD